MPTSLRQFFWCSTFLTLSLFPQLAAAPPLSGSIRTIIGTGDASLAAPRGIAVDASGNLFIAESTSGVIRKVSAGTGVISTSAVLDQPVDVVVDSQGNLYVASGSFGRVWKIDASQNVTAFAGSGVATDALGDNGPALSARLRHASAIALGSGGILYIADSSDHRVRKVDASGIITTIAGTGTPGFGGENGPATAALLRSPSGLAVGSDGAVYISDRLNNRIRRVDPGTGIIHTVAGRGEWGSGGFGDGGPAVNAWIYDPYGITLDASGVLYISDAAGSRVWRVDAAGQIAIVVGTGVAGFNGDDGELNTRQVSWPKDVSLDVDGRLFIADTYNYRVRRVTFGSGLIARPRAVFRGRVFRADTPDDDGVADDGDDDAEPADEGDARADGEVDGDDGAMMAGEEEGNENPVAVGEIDIGAIPGAGAALPQGAMEVPPPSTVRELTLDDLGPPVTARLPDGSSSTDDDGGAADADASTAPASGCSLILK